MVAQEITYITRIARPYLVLYQRNKRWYIYAGKTQEEAREKAESLLRAKRTKMCILCKVMRDVRLKEQINDAEENE